jgi:hypothetical protein
MVRGLAGAFDDTKVAQLLATALALDGKASDRLATIFNTIAPDADRKRRVLTMTRSLLSETDFGKSGQFQVLWTSMEELLVSYDDTPYVSEVYKSALDGVGARAARMSAVDLPPDLPAWMESLGQANVRGLSRSALCGATRRCRRWRRRRGGAAGSAARSSARSSSTASPRCWRLARRRRTTRSATRRRPATGRSRRPWPRSRPDECRLRWRSGNRVLTKWKVAANHRREPKAKRLRLLRARIARATRAGVGSPRA